MRKPEDPKCVGCENIKVACTYTPTPKQLEKARKQAAGNADPSVAYPGVDIGRRILPRPQAPAVSYGGSTAGSAQQRQYPEAPGSSLGGFAAGSPASPEHPNVYSEVYGGFTAGQPVYPHRLHLGFGGRYTPSNEISQPPQGLTGGFEEFSTTVHEPWQRFQGPNSAFGQSETRPSGYLQYSQQPPWAFGGLRTQYTNLTQRSQQPAPEVWGISRTPSDNSPVLGGYPHTPSGHSSAFGGPSFAFGGSPVGVSPYARNPTVGLDGTLPSLPRDLPRPPEWRQTRQG